eukprot:6666147-Alexandrium_andersonii.AAC.1
MERPSALALDASLPEVLVQVLNQAWAPVLGCVNSGLHPLTLTHGQSSQEGTWVVVRIRVEPAGLPTLRHFGPLLRPLQLRGQLLLARGNVGAK